VLVYWCLALPHRVGVIYGWSVGLMLDVLRVGLLGQQALSMAVIAFITLQIHKQVRVYPLMQQSAAVLVLVTTHQMLQLWINGIIGQTPQFWSHAIPALSSMLIWPLVYFTLRNIRRSFLIN